jgi:integrase
MKGLHFVPKKRRGRVPVWYVYAYRGGPLIARREGLHKPTLKADEMRAAVQAVEALAAPDPRKLVSLIREWEASPDWQGLGAGTRKTWRSQLSAIERRWGDAPLSVWNDPRITAKVVDWRDERQDTPRGADLGVSVLRELLKFGRMKGRVLINAAEGVPTLYRGGNRAEIVWTEDDMDRFQWHALKLNQPQLIDGLWLAALTGLRPQDQVSVSLSNIYETAIIKKALKVSRRRRRTATLPRIPELDALLDELATRKRAEGVETLLVNSFGKSWSRDGYVGAFGRVARAAGIVHVDEETKERRQKHLHDIRGTFATNLILNGLTDKDVAECMAWSVERVAGIRRVYVDQARVVVAIGLRIATGTNGEGVNPSVNRPGGDHEK